jgi:gliding motility-associated protein GldM
MGHGKETPRQKMIGMMYLFLTAMLALNVQKEVLNAFVNVDTGLTKTTENFKDKNELMYSAFAQADITNHAKAGKYVDLAHQVQKRTKEIIDYIQSLKVEVITQADGKKAEAIEDGSKINPLKINAKDNQDIPANIMINKGKAKDLRKEIQELNSFFVGILDPKAESVKESIDKSLETKDPPLTPDGERKTWETENFEHIPLIAVVTELSAIQANVRNAESDILRYLYASIDAGAFTFNKLEAVVLSKSNYVLKGNQYSAQIFIAASDSTQNPEIFIGAYDSIRQPDGSYILKMKQPYETVPVKNGKGLYTVSGGAVGTRKWGGLIKLKSPNGGADITRSFRAEYQVSEPSAVISASKMNVFYRDVPGGNPVDISVPGIPSDKVSATITNGSIAKTADGGWAVNPGGGPSAVITIYADVEGSKRVIGTKTFRVKAVPDPVAKVGGSKGGGLSKEMLLASPFAIAQMENFDFELNCHVVSFKMELTVGGYNKESISKSNKLTPEMEEYINRGAKNTKLYFSEIKAVVGTQVRELTPVTITLK